MSVDPEIVARYRRGETLQSLQEDARLSPAALSRRLKHAGVDVRPRGRQGTKVPPDRETLLAWVKSGLSDPAIAALNSVGKRTVQKWRMHHGIQSEWDPHAPRKDRKRR